ncbi:MAG: flagellin [bacterium]
MGIQGINHPFSTPPARKMSLDIRSGILRSIAKLSADSALDSGKETADTEPNHASRQSQIPELIESITALQAGINQATVTREGLGAITERLRRIEELIQQSKSQGNFSPKILQDRQEEIRRITQEIGRIGATARMVSDSLSIPSRDEAREDTSLPPGDPVTAAEGDSTASTLEDTPAVVLATVTNGVYQLGAVQPETLGLGPGRTLNDIDITREGGLDEAWSITQAALTQVHDTHTAVEVFLSRLENTTNHLSVMSENLMASRPRILDTHFAAESTRVTVLQVMTQARISIHAQLNHLFNHMFTDLLQ